MTGVEPASEFLEDLNVPHQREQREVVSTTYQASAQAGGREKGQPTQADRIRQYLSEQVFEPARRAGKSTVIVRAGDVHRDMGLKAQMPNVCQVLAGKRIREKAGVSIVHRQGPNAGANAKFTFSLGPVR